MAKLNNKQEDLLSNPNILTTFLYLLDGKTTMDQIVRRTGMKPLEISVYLDRLIEVGLIYQSKSVGVGSKSVKVLYEVTDSDLDLSSVVDHLSPSTTLDLMYNKIKEDIIHLETEDLIKTHAKINYAQIKVRKGAYEKFAQMIAEAEKMIQSEEAQDGDESVSLLVIGYRHKQNDL